jgi:predicted MFS family arabinose efflux permease
MGLHGVGGTLGVVLTPTIAWFIGVNLGWPYAFVTFGVLSILVAILFINKPGRNGSRNGNWGTIIDAFRIRELWVLLAFNVAIGLFMKGVELFFPTYLYRNRGVDQMWASIAYTVMLAVGVLGQWVGGKAADKIGSKKVLIATSLGVAISLLSLLLVPAYIVGISIFIILYGLTIPTKPTRSGLRHLLFHILRHWRPFTIPSRILGNHVWLRLSILHAHSLCHHRTSTIT